MRAKSKVQELLSQKPKGKKVSRNYQVSEATAEAFSALCDSRDLSPSEVVEAMMEDLLAAQKPEPKPVPVAVKKAGAKKEAAL